MTMSEVSYRKIYIFSEIEDGILEKKVRYIQILRKLFILVLNFQVLFCKLFVILRKSAKKPLLTQSR